MSSAASSNRHGEWPLEGKVYIGDLGNDATRYELEEAFTPFGAVKNIWIAKKPPGYFFINHVFFVKYDPAGFAFVLMDDPRDAQDAVKELDGSRICGRRVKVCKRSYFREIYKNQLKLKRFHVRCKEKRYWLSEIYC